ncbi:hypothetical protein ACLB2K_004391 [Fragaria x ananassa]
MWVSNEEIVSVSSSPDSDSGTLHRWKEELDKLMAEIALDLGEGIPVTDVGCHVSSSDPLLQESIPDEVLLRPLGRGVKFWDSPGNFTLVYEYQLRCGLTFPLPPFVQYILACLHVAPGKVTPNMLRQILGTGVLFRLLRQEFPNFEEFNACWNMGVVCKEGQPGLRDDEVSGKV